MAEHSVQRNDRDYATCENCGKDIQRSNSMGIKGDWWHSKTGMAPCPDIVATPAKGGSHA